MLLPYAIVGGVPTKLIRYRFDEDVIEKIEESKWWEWEDEILRKEIGRMGKGGGEFLKGEW